VHDFGSTLYHFGALLNLFFLLLPHPRVLLALAFLTISALATDTALVPQGAVWKYLNDGTNQGIAWRDPAFNDGHWASRTAKPSYGDGDQSTRAGFRSDPNSRQSTTYLRHSFSLDSTSGIAALKLQLLRDDGAIVYLNGVEVARSNMPTGAVSDMSASAAVCCAEESQRFTIAVDPARLRTGTNVIAVELQRSESSTIDSSFDLSLTASTTPSITRGPYLQMATSNTMVVRWRTSVPTDSRVQYGTNPISLTSQANDATLTTEHKMRIYNLQSNTRYYYSVGSSTYTLASGSSYFFKTSPTSSTPTRVWVIGDSGTANSNARAVRDAYLKYTGSTATNLWLMLGDNAYASGTDAEYQAAVFNTYPQVLRNTVLWPTIGNHDTAEQTTVSSSLPYFQMFTLPTTAEAGGVASGTEKYYSFNYGNIHFIVLDSMTSDRSPSGQMLTWLKSDLAATTKTWIIASWHHPPYSKGSHNSDTETQLIEMRKNALPILEDAGVDLVLAGHSHSYERSYLLDGHYGSSSTLSPVNKLNSGSGRADGSGAYLKKTASITPHEGAVYAVAGNAGSLSGGTLNHPAMYISLNQLGSMVLDINGNRLDAKMIRETGAVADYFTIFKGPAPAKPTSPSNLTGSPYSSSRIDLRWADNSTNEDGFEVMRSTDGVNFSRAGLLGRNSTYFSNTGLPPSTKYYYRVRAYNVGGKSGYSNTVTVLTASSTSSISIDLRWTDNSTNEDGFEVIRSSDGVNFARVGLLGRNSTYFSNTGLSPSTKYYYRVRAYNAVGRSAYSDTVSATTKAQ
jgi:phosphodiesterase/alkaline phosphatase D-like protein